MQAQHEGIDDGLRWRKRKKIKATPKPRSTRDPHHVPTPTQASGRCEALTPRGSRCTLDATTIVFELVPGDLRPRQCCAAHRAKKLASKVRDAQGFGVIRWWEDA
jgi:hypothetical protein